MPSQNSSPISRVTPLFALIAVYCIFAPHAPADEPAPNQNLLTNGRFEQGMDGWDNPWAREGKITAKEISSDSHGGEKAAQVEHTGEKDWSFPWKNHVEVTPGEVFRLSGWIRVQGKGNVTPCVTLYDAEHQPMDWVYGEATLTASDGWRRFESQFAIPRGVGFIWPRVVGNGPATVLLDDLSLVREGMLPEMEKTPLTKTATLENALVRMDFSAEDGTFTLLDKRTDHTWRQKASLPVMVLNVAQTAESVVAKMIEPETLRQFSVTWRLDPRAAEVLVDIEGVGPLDGELRYPYPFVSDPSRQNDQLIMPVNEGIAYPVDDETLHEMWYHLYGGHGLCMGWYGMTGGGTGTGDDGLMTIVETPDDAAVHTPAAGRAVVPRPHLAGSEKGEFGPARRLRYVLFDSGGYVAMCKRYRDVLQEPIGLFKTLSDKRQENPNVDLLIGAVNVWCWDADRGRKMPRDARIGHRPHSLERIGPKPETLREAQRNGRPHQPVRHLPGLHEPGQFPQAPRHVHGDWTCDQWPDGIIIDKNGDWSRGWQGQGKGRDVLPLRAACAIGSPPNTPGVVWRRN